MVLMTIGFKCRDWLIENAKKIVFFHAFLFIENTSTSIHMCPSKEMYIYTLFFLLRLFSIRIPLKGRNTRAKKREEKHIFCSEFVFVIRKSNKVTFDGYSYNWFDLTMGDEKSKKPLRLKTFGELQNDSVYEIHLLPRKRKTTVNKSSAPVTPNGDDEHDADDRVRQIRNFFRLSMRSLKLYQINFKWIFVI